LQILEDSGKYWSYQYCIYWKISYEIAECTCILFFFPCLCICYEMTDNFGNDQYLLVLQMLENSGRYWKTSIYQYCRYWKVLVKYW
jgi:hypothetical protein